MGRLLPAQALAPLKILVNEAESSSQVDADKAENNYQQAQAKWLELGGMTKMLVLALQVRTGWRTWIC